MSESVTSIPEKKFRPVQLVSNGKDSPLQVVSEGGTVLFTINQDGTAVFSKAVTFEDAIEVVPDPGAALTAQTVASTSITHTAASPADYLIQNLTDTGGFGFVTANEGNSLIAVLKNAVLRIAEIEARLIAAEIIEAP